MHWDNLVFAGGGSRCLWQAGFVHRLYQDIKTPPTQIAAVSAGAFMALLWIMGKLPEAIEYIAGICRYNRKNAYWGNLFSEDPVHPHYGIYREALLKMITSEGIARLKNGPELRVAVARLPESMPFVPGAILGLMAYKFERKIMRRMNPMLGVKLGYKVEYYNARDCGSRFELAELLLASSCTPPFTPLLHFRGRPALDGGIINNVPIAGINNPGSTLILLSRHYPDLLPPAEGKLYVQPSRPLVLHPWDYTNEEEVYNTYALGSRDAEAFLKTEQIATT